MISNISERLSLKISLTCWILISLFGIATNQQVSGELGGQLSGAVNHHNIPGHYEFEVAPKMEPPVVRKPPYPASSQLCPGLDPFAGFSVKNTLCGDLNQGRVPLNPLGQMIDDQSYPFDLIKNKTLQFLARALPVLKLEYETIPKVARYLPANHLLNPTHQASPLASDHLQRINQRLASGMDASEALVDHFDQHMQQAPPIFLRRRRRSAAPVTGEQSRVAAEIVSNANIVIHSAHSGKIHSTTNWNDSSPVGAVITKAGPNRASARPITQKPAQPTQQVNSNNINHNGHNNLAQSGHKAPVEPINEQAPTSGGKLAQVVVGQLQLQQQQQQQQANEGADPTDATLSTNNSGDRKQRNGILGSSTEQHSHLGQLSNSDSGGEITQAVNQPYLDKTKGSTNKQQPTTTTADHSAVKLRQTTSHLPTGDSQSSGASNKQTARNRAAAACGNDLVSSIICQMATAFIDSNSQTQPSWLQAAKQLGALYTGASSDAFSGPTLWSLLSGFGSQASAGTGSPSPQHQKQTTHNSSHSQSAVRTSPASSGLMSIIGPLASMFTASDQQVQAKESSGSQNKEQPLTLNQAMYNIALAGWASNAVYKVAEYFLPSLVQSISSLGGDKGFAKRKKPFDSQEQFVDTPASMAANLKQSAGNVPVSGKQQLPPTPCPSVEEYISPTFARNYQGAWKYVVQIPHEGYFTQTIQRTSCVRQRCEFTEGVCHESPRWVSLLVAEIYYPNTIFGQAAGADQAVAAAAAAGQVSMQSAQQPHQSLATSSSTSSVQQVAMNAPPTTMRQQQQQQSVFMHSPKQQQNAFGGSPDPLQMTDSLSTYNHNLQNAFINVANDLGLDPNNVANMQQLANMYNYQLMQRSGLSPGNQPTLESRSGNIPATTTANNIPQQQLPNDYIMALAEATLKENPKMSIEELILSLRHQTAQLQQMSVLNRKRRDTSQQQVANAQIRRQQTNAGPQHRSGTGSNVENPQSLNDISTTSLNNGQYQLSKQQIGALQQQQQGSSPLQAQLMAQHQPLGSPEVGQSLGNANQLPTGPSADGHQQQQAGSETQGSNNQECDGHDKLGCYVVRVYYDWFLVNGSCKCWKTGSQTAGQSSGSSQSSGFLRRIFTG